MTELDTEILPLAAELIDEYGKLITYSSVQSGEYDPETGTNTKPNNIEKTIKAIVEDVKGNFAAGNLIEKADKKITIASNDLNFKPKTSDVFEVDGVNFTVGEKGVKRIYSGELVAVYEIYGAS